MGFHDDIGNNIMRLPIEQNIIEALKKKEELKKEKEKRDLLISKAFKNKETID